MIPDPAEKRASHRARRSASLLGTRDLVEAAGLNCRIISAGGSGSYQLTADIAGITEIQAGGGIFACQYYTQVCHVTGHRPAISVLATVVSRPYPDRAILDIGQKSVSQYQASPSSSRLSQIAQSSVFPQNTPRLHSIRRQNCKLEKKCTSFRVIAILLLCCTIAYWVFAEDVWRPSGTSSDVENCSRIGMDCTYGRVLSPIMARKSGLGGGRVIACII